MVKVTLDITCTYIVLSGRTYEDLYVRLARLTRLKMKLILNLNIRFGSSEMWIGRGAVRRNWIRAGMWAWQSKMTNCGRTDPCVKYIRISIPSS